MTGDGNSSPCSWLQKNVSQLPRDVQGSFSSIESSSLTCDYGVWCLISFPQEKEVVSLSTIQTVIVEKANKKYTIWIRVCVCGVGGGGGGGGGGAVIIPHTQIIMYQHSSLNIALEQTR